MTDENVKKVDESWKERAAAEIPVQDRQKTADYPPADFVNFITSLSMQAMSSLGILPDPSGKKEKDLSLAKYLIDTVAMLEEKTKNNVNDSEAKFLEHLLYDLRMRFVEANNDNRAHSS